MAYRSVARRRQPSDPCRMPPGPARRARLPLDAKLCERHPQLADPLGLAQLEGRDEYLGEHGHGVERAPDHEVYQVIAGVAVDLLVVLGSAEVVAEARRVGVLVA